MVYLAAHLVKNEAAVSDGLLRRCEDCGFLAIRRRDNRQLVEAEASYRKNGVMPSEIGMLVGPREPQPKDFFEAAPVCFALAFDLSKETPNESPPEICRALQLNRSNCKSFTPWRQGFSPKEHQEMLDRQWMLEREAERERAAAAEADKAREFQREQTRLQRWHEGEP